MTGKEYRIARKRIKILYEMSKIELKKGNIDLSRRYTSMIIKISRKYNVKLPRNIKRSICKKCFTLLIPGITLDIRIRKGKIICSCRVCGYVKRTSIKNK